MLVLVANLRRPCTTNAEAIKNMPIEKKRPNLAVLKTLERIVSYLADQDCKLTATTLKNRLDLEGADFEIAAKYGCDLKVIKWWTQNYYSAEKEYTVPEEAYYDVISEALQSLWLKEKFDRSQFYIENTSHRDSKIIGPWTRPDLTLVSYKRFPWTIGNEFDVVTFEVKRPDYANVLAVFEALSHGAAATRAYVVFPVEEAAWRRENEAQAQRVHDECVRHGVGLILVDPSSVKPIANHVLRAARHEIDHEKCSDFLGAVVSEEGKKRISAWKS